MTPVSAAASPNRSPWRAAKAKPARARSPRPTTRPRPPRASREPATSPSPTAAAPLRAAPSTTARAAAQGGSRGANTTSAARRTPTTAAPGVTEPPCAHTNTHTTRSRTVNNAVGGTPIPTRPTADALSTLLSGPSTRIAHLLRVKGEWCAIFRIPLQQWLLHYSLDLPSSGEGRPRVDGCDAGTRRLNHPRPRRRQSISDSLAAGGAQEPRPALPTADTAPPGSPAGALRPPRVALGCLTVAIGLLLIPAPAQADFGFNRLEDNFIEAEGGPARQAGSHPFAQEIAFQLNTTSSGEFVAGAIRNLNATAPTGLAGNPTAVPQCETIAFLSYGEQGAGCPDATALGTIDVELAAGLGIRHIVTAPVYNLRPAPGVAAKLGFVISDVPVTVNLGLSPNPPYNVVGSLSDTSQVLEVFGSRLVLWGVPADPVHDPDRGNCAKEGVKGSCPANLAPKPFLTLPRSCTGPLSTGFAATSWSSREDPPSPGPPSSFTGAAESPGMLECSALAFNPTITAQPTSRAASSPSGLDFSLDVKNEGLANPEC